MISAVITGAGSSTRFGKNKMLEPIDGKPLLIRTLLPFLECERVDEIVVTAKKEDIEKYSDEVKKHLNEYASQIAVIEGGKERIDSVLNGVKKTKGSIVITHDGARPLTQVSLIEDLIKAVEETGAAMTAINPTATVKMTDDSMIIQDTLLRAKTWIAQTPQGFKREIILDAFEKAVAKKYFVPTDDSEIVTIMTDTKVTVVRGHPSNIKVTYPEDLAIATQLFSEMKK